MHQISAQFALLILHFNRHMGINNLKISRVLRDYFVFRLEKLLHKC